ncbi:class I SAM-dependent methyltransferase [soil metagenome]
MIVKNPTFDSLHADTAAAPSAWVRRWSHLVAAGGTVLDVACGHGRHARWFHERNHPVVLVDRARDAIESIAIPAAACEAVVADIENGPWPFTGRQFDAVVVTHYLWRPLMPTLLDSLAPGGVLIYETFTQGNETVGKPSRPEFLLRTGELLTLCGRLRIVAFEDGFQEAPHGQAPRFVQRIAAVREDVSPAGLGDPASSKVSNPPRYPLL